MPENNNKEDRHQHRGTEDIHQEEDKTGKKMIGELDEMIEEKIEDLESMTIIMMMKEEDPPHALGATKDIEVNTNIIKEDGTITHIQIHQKDRLYKSQYQ